MAEQPIPEQNNFITRLPVEYFRLGLCGLFLLGIFLLTTGYIPATANGILLVIAAIIGGYMAINIGANDVANNVGPTVGSKALTIFWAIVIAAVCEAAGALIAGGDVVRTVKKGIIDPGLIGSTDEFIWLMMAALLAASIWLNLATMTGTPVSTTHSIVGGVLGAGLAAGGMDVANWAKLGAIAASWVVSPMMGGIIAAATLYSIKRWILYKRDKLDAARRIVPILIALMAWAFGTYIIIKGLSKIVKVEFLIACLIGLGFAIVIFMLVRPMIARKSHTLSNERESINHLFTIPLICSAALLSFAHGANDVANAVGPLAAINDAIQTGGITSKAEIPLWIMLIGALGIALGLALYGPRLIRVVGTEITELNQIRAYCIALAAALTVILASQLGLPVSSTHVAVGAVFGVGFLREAIETNYAVVIDEIKVHHREMEKNEDAVNSFLGEFEQADMGEKEYLLKNLKKQYGKSLLSKSERKELKKLHHQELVTRSALYRIAAAWVITVPVSACLAAFFYFTLRGMLL